MTIGIGYLKNRAYIVLVVLISIRWMIYEYFLDFEWFCWRISRNFVFVTDEYEFVLIEVDDGRYWNGK